MLPLLTLLPSIFSTVSKVSDLFNKGKEAVETITGKPSEASTPDELKDEVQSLPEAQQASWAQTMQQKIDLYKVENDRLDIEIGRITPELQSKLSSKDAGKIAVMRQTTRPWAVRMMVHYVFFPFYLVLFDSAQLALSRWFNFSEGRVFKSFDYVFGNLSLDKVNASLIDKLTSIPTIPQTLAGELYMNSVAWVVGVIVSYMGLREYGKYKGTSGDTASPVTAGSSNKTSVIEDSLGLVSKVRKAFGK